MYIGIDLGGTNIGIGIVDKENNLILKDSIPTRRERGYAEIVQDIVNLINKVIANTNINKREIEGIGIGIPGIVEPQSGIIINSVNLKWKQVPIKKLIEAEFQIPIYIGNDATVAGVAEFEVGAMKGCKSGVLLTLGTGVGAGIIINGKVYDGFNGVGSEIGHMIVGENYYHCNCGRNGCLETFCSSTAIINYAIKLINEGKSSAILEYVEDDISKINGKVIFEAAQNGDSVACQVVDRMVKYLSIGIVNTISVIDPEIFVIGGGLSASGDFLLSKIKQQVLENTYYKEVEVGRVVLSNIGNDGGIIGAANLCKHQK
ncbi:ROK family glucokinase [Clostridium sp.]|uniref:ROK family protein n=1 Tax=Clostridium sp. TaxID=1506 RepID=UPI003217565C